MKKFFLILLLCISFACFAQGKSEFKDSEYVASTSWVASIAELAGLDNVVTIAPANLKHPPEYEITPSDVYVVSKASLFMHAGYERMMKTIGNAAEVDQSRILKVKTTNTLENLENMVKMLSEKAGTQKIAQERFSKYKAMIIEARKKIASSSNANICVYANKNQSEFLEDLGLNVVSTFGTEPLTSDQIAEAAGEGYVLVVDNYHNPVASPVKTVSPESIVLVFKNFPEKLEKDALYNVIRENLELLWATGLFD